eukprot:TRINITY_DN2562_c0_g1_i10.p1 TRINITY_DN2562_c0_g1~~TRINITY_DN2562_c0_g1_i10.p1  ORF type:complete len:346 (+),score=81.33 TRINITY_DN2562_c0_g1_i10:79-1116(+)
MAAPPPSLKSVTPYLKHANQLAKLDPVAAYCCRLFSVQRGVALRSSAAPSEGSAVTQFLLSQMDILEREKAALQASETGLPANDAMQEHMTRFAFRVFLMADDEDRAGQASKETARNFLSASQFMEVLAQFEELPAELQDKIKYAKWKAADISSCINRGVKPNPGPPGYQPEEDGNGTSGFGMDITFPQQRPSTASPFNTEPGSSVSAPPSAFDFDFDFPTVPTGRGSAPPAATNSSSFDSSFDLSTAFPTVPSGGGGNASTSSSTTTTAATTFDFDFPSVPGKGATTNTSSGGFSFPSPPSGNATNSMNDYSFNFPSVPSQQQQHHHTQNVGLGERQITWWWRW